MTKYNLDHEKPYENLQNALMELLKYGSIPIVNENDAIATDEIEFGENDTLSAMVASIVDADLLILLTDTDGLYTDDPFLNKEATLIDVVTEWEENTLKMAKKSSDSDVGTGGMYTKVLAANLVNPLGIDMIISSGKNPSILNKILKREHKGTLFLAKDEKIENRREYLQRKIGGAEK